MNRNSAISKKISWDDIVEGLGMKITGVNPKEIANMDREARRNLMEANLYTSLRGNKSQTRYAPSRSKYPYENKNRRDVKIYDNAEREQRMANELNPREFAESVGRDIGRKTINNIAYERAIMRNQNIGRKAIRYAIPIGLGSLAAALAGNAIGSGSVPSSADMKNKLTGIYNSGANAINYVGENAKRKNNEANDYLKTGVKNLKNSFDLYGNKTRNAYDAFVNTVDDNGKPRVQKSISKRGAISKKITFDDILRELGMNITGVSPKKVLDRYNQSNDAYYNRLHAQAKLGNSSFDYRAPRTVAERKAYKDREQQQYMAERAIDSYNVMQENIGRFRRGESMRNIGLGQENYLPDFYPKYPSNRIRDVREQNRRTGKKAIAAAITGAVAIPLAGMMGYQDGKNRVAQRKYSGRVPSK
jgi:hypothetical protein